MRYSAFDPAMIKLAKQVQAIELGAVFGLSYDGILVEVGNWMLDCPTVRHSEEEDVEIEDHDGQIWEALTGFTMQYGYNGAVMHASEFIGSNMLVHLLELVDEGQLGLFATTSVEVMDDPEHPAGWVILHCMVP